MKATPAKGTPAKGTPAKAGGGLFAFGFSKKAESTPPSNTPKTSASSDSEDGVEVVRDIKTISAGSTRAQASASSIDLSTSTRVHQSRLNEPMTEAQPKQLPVQNMASVQPKASGTSAAPSSATSLPASSERKSIPAVNTKRDEPKSVETKLKKRRVILDDDEEEEMDGANQIKSASTSATAKTKSREESSDSEVSSLDSDDSESDDDVDEASEEDDVPAPKKIKKTTPSKASTPGKASSPPSGSPSGSDEGNRSGVRGAGEHEHDLLPWYQEHKDANLRLPAHPEYDETTMFVPPGYLEGKPAFHLPGKARKITDAMRVWWEFFSKNADCVIAFKVGKFYEMYHGSADVAVRYCDLLFMRGETAHCGFPESAWAKNMSKLVNANYRVARIEQTETPEAMTERTGKKTGMVRREVCQVLSPGTMTLSVRDSGDGFVSRPDGRIQLVCIAESDSVTGVCVLDASTGRFRCGQFPIDEHRVGLRACLAFEMPAEIVYVPTNVSSMTLAVIKAETKSLHTTLTPSKQLASVNWKSTYFPGSSNDQVPEILCSLETDQPVANQALLNCLRVLRRALVDDELVTMGRFSKYITPTASVDVKNQDAEIAEDQEARSENALLLKMDAQALRHLEIVSNATDGSRDGTLLEYMDRTRSPFGARLFREWVTRPLASVPHIAERQCAVQACIAVVNDSSVAEFRRVLAQTPDLERNLSKIHAIGLDKKKSHPDTRAVIYGADEINKSKIETLCATLTALKNVRSAAGKLKDAFETSFASAPKSKTVTRLLQGLTSEVAQERLSHFDKAFDAKQAKKTGIIEPREGVVASYDECQRGLAETKDELTEYLNKMKKQLALPLTYYMPAQGKQKFQIEVAETKQVPSDWVMASKRKGFKRYISPVLKDLTTKLVMAEQALAEASVDVTRTVFAEFDKHKHEWLALVRSAAEMDCIISLALVSCESVQSCLPQIIPKTESKQAFLELVQAKHPCVAASLDRLGKNSFIPNDTVLNGTRGKCMLLTGPNMGGKSTLLRQTCLAVIMAQIGCFVQAESYRGTPVDAIFTRVGASDKILEGQSTFFVELSETATILQSATEDSLVILDELGRGTSTFDGTAIAHAVINKLLAVGCRTMFATHYHSLVREVGKAAGVCLGHMACVADTDANEPDRQDVTFLYKLEDGAVDRSYGLNVARLARLPESIIKRAHVMSQRFEHAFERHLRKRLLEEMQQVCLSGDVKRLREAVVRAECFVAA